MKRVVTILTIIALVAILAGGVNLIGGCEGGGVGLSPPAPPATGIIYIANTCNSSILGFHNAATVNGDLPPDVTLAGEATTIALPYHIFLDQANDRLFIADSNTNSVLIYDNASTVNGDIAPNRTLTGPATNLDQPTGIFVDSNNNTLYVGNFVGSSITIYDDASRIDGNTPPARQVTELGDTPCGIGVDSRRDIMYCVLSGTDTIGVWDNAAIVDGEIPPTRAVSGPATLLDVPDGVYLDSTNDRIYIANAAGQSVTVFNNASIAGGNIAPGRTLTGANTRFSDPRGVTIDPANDRLFITNVGDHSISIFNNASAINGDIAPTRRIAGAATTLDTPLGIAVDMTRAATR